jgi:hypothetical protein
VVYTSSTGFAFNGHDSISREDAHRAARCHHVGVPAIGQLLQFGVDVPGVVGQAGGVGGVRERLAVEHDVCVLGVEGELLDQVAVIGCGDLDGGVIAVASVLVAVEIESVTVSVSPGSSCSSAGGVNWYTQLV